MAKVLANAVSSLIGADLTGLITAVWYHNPKGIFFASFGLLVFGLIRLLILDEEGE